MKITYDDIAEYGKRPFDLKKPFITDGNFTVIKLESKNLEKAYEYLSMMNDLLAPYKHLIDCQLPNVITTEKGIGLDLPKSHIRLCPYTPTMEKCKYPIILWLADEGYYGNTYLFQIYFSQSGEVGKSDLRFWNYTAKISRNESGLFVKRLMITLKEPPYLTWELYPENTLIKEGLWGKFKPECFR